MEIDWKNLGFSYMPVNSNIRFSFRDGKWGKGRLTADFNINVPAAATCFHYGQACFEGLKAFKCKDGKIRVFRPEENARRLNKTLSHILAPEVPEDMFIGALKELIKDNEEYVPPYGTGGSLYIRPFVIGTSPQIGISPSKDYEFVMMVMPVGPYYKSGIKPVIAYIIEEYDRAAPSGTGHVKVAGNYAAGLLPRSIAHNKGAQVALFMDPATHQYVEEFGTSNFIAVTKDGKYVTPDSCSILGSITNLSLMQLARDLGIDVERRKVHRSELKDFAEVGACGTAVVITPVGNIIGKNEDYKYGTGEMGPVLKRLYMEMTGVQFGEIPDKHNWLLEL